MSDVIYPEGVRTFAPHKNAPEFVLGTVIISMNELFTYAKAHPELLTNYKGDKQLKLSCVKRKGGGIVLSVDTWKPDKKDINVKESFDLEPEKTYEPTEELPF